MSLATSDLALKGFANIDATAATKHSGFVTRALLARIVEITNSDDIVLVIECMDAATVYKDICECVPGVDRRASMVNAILTFFDNSPEVAQAYASRKKEWVVIKDLVEEQERACVAAGGSGVTIATGMAWTNALEHNKTFDRLLKVRLSTVELKSTIQRLVDDMVDCWQEEPAYGDKILEPWKRHLELLDLFHVPGQR